MNEPIDTDFFELVDEKVLDRYLEVTHAQDAKKTVELPEFSKPEAELLIDGQIHAFDQSIDRGDVAEACLHYRVLQRLLDIDDDYREQYEKVMSQHPIEALLQGSFGGGGH